MLAVSRAHVKTFGREALMLRAISLYSGVGGLDFGFEAAGFRTAVAVELDAIACRTMRLNRDWPVLEGDIHSISSKEILATAGVRPGEADVLIGGPPCQPFSKSSYWVRGDAGRLDDPRSDTLTAYLRVLRDARPRAFLLENVQGLAYKGKDEGLQLLLKGIAEVNRQAGTNYRVSWKSLNAAAYGVPQIRERVFLIGSRDGALLDFPLPTHVDAVEESGLTRALEPYRTAWDGIGDLSAHPDDDSLVMGGQWADLLPSIPEGQNYLWHTKRGGGLPLFGWRTRYWSFLLKLSKNRPSWTIQAQPGSSIGPFHWNNRKLSAQEMCRLQTFPDGLRFDCGRTDIQKMLGNAVPSLLTEILARSVRRQILGGERRQVASLKLLPPRRGPIPDPERVCPVPQKYRGLIGDHADHPGEGKGRMALERSNSAARPHVHETQASLFAEQGE
jgi:DNA (cytosine-5)-methyltransferase 1